MECSPNDLHLFEQQISDCRIDNKSFRDERFAHKVTKTFYYENFTSKVFLESALAPCGEPLFVEQNLSCDCNPMKPLNFKMPLSFTLLG